MMINETLKGLDFHVVYLGDIIIYSKSEREHDFNIKQVFYQYTRLASVGLL